MVDPHNWRITEASRAKFMDLLVLFVSDGNFSPFM